MAPDSVNVPPPVLVSCPLLPLIVPSKAVLAPLPPAVRVLAPSLTCALVAAMPDNDPTVSLFNKLSVLPLASVRADPSGTAAPFCSLSSPTVTAVAPP